MPAVSDLSYDAWLQHAFGPPETLAYEDVPEA